MELRQIEYFIAVSHFKSFTKAAQKLFVTQPTLTIAIKNLEKEFGLSLLTREHGNLALTKDGEIFLEYAKKIASDVNETLVKMTSRNANAGEVLRIGIPTVTGALMYPVLLNQYKATRPNVNFYISDAGNLDIIKQVGSGELEIGFVSLSCQLDSHFQRLPLCWNQMCVISSDNHPYSNLCCVDIRDFSKAPIIMYYPGESYTEVLLAEQFQKAGLTLTIHQRIKHSVTLFEMVAQGHGVSAILNDQPEAVNQHPCIAIRPFKKPIWIQTGLIWDKKRPLSECAKHFIGFVLENPPFPDFCPASPPQSPTVLSPVPII